MPLAATQHNTPFQIVKWSDLRNELCKMIGCAPENFRNFETFTHNFADETGPLIPVTVDLWEICVENIVAVGCPLDEQQDPGFNPMEDTMDTLESPSGVVLACIMVQENFDIDSTVEGPEKAVCLAYKELNKQLNTDTIKTYINFVNGAMLF